MVDTTRKKGGADPSPRKRLGLGYFIAAAVFLANPCLNIIDILPDFLGYMFLLKGLEKWADLCPNVRDAVQGIAKLRWFMLIKMLAMALVPLVDATYVLVFTFAFIMIELIYAIPAAGRVFDGLEYFGTRFDGKSVFRGLKDLRALTNIFFFVKSAFCLLPELCELSSYEYSGIVTGGVQIDPSAYKNPLILLNLLVCTVLGLIWLINCIKYIKALSGDTGFLTRVLEDYDREITNDMGLTVRRTLRSAFTLIIAGSVFFVSLWIDGINIIPTFIGAALIVCAIIRLSRITPIAKSLKVWAVIFTALSAASFIMMITTEIVRSAATVDLGYLTENLTVIIKHNFASELTPAMRDELVDAVRTFDKYSGVYAVFFTSLASELLKYIAMAVTAGKLIGVMKKLVKMHLGPDPDVTDSRLISIYSENQKSTNRGITAGSVLFVIALAVAAVHGIIRTAIPSEVYIVPLIAMGIWIIYMANTLNSLYDQIEYRYM